MLCHYCRASCYTTLIYRQIKKPPHSKECGSKIIKE
uniref:Uncharacterized protein n=1 Tax=Staphylococcus phage HS15 TaxID=3056405 RepID=A0AA50AEZ6_9VIRU|nr:MAG: hypothetical protein [Staphylococcus phage HS15]